MALDSMVATNTDCKAASIMSASPLPLSQPHDTLALRLFFALWPDRAQRQHIAAHQAQWQWAPPAQPTPAAKLHLTVLFMEGVPADRVTTLLEAGERVARHGTDFALTLDRAAIWRHGGIAHLAPSQPPAALLSLRAVLAQQVGQLGLPFDARAFAPHVTLARRAQNSQPPNTFAPLRWTVRGFSLVHSVLGTGRYDVIGRWPLLDQ